MSPPAPDRPEEAPGVVAPREPQARLDELHEALGPLPRADLPIALLPVRLETRFVPAGAQVDFCVRIYPDDLHVETHEPELLGIELIHGRHAWEQIWRASEDEARRKAAWAQLAQRFGPPRAGWILRATRPANPQDRPAAPVADEQPLPISPRFVDVPLHDEAWTRAPTVRTLPDRWVVFGYREGQRALVTWGEQIPPELAAGPSPAGPEEDVPDDQLPLDSGMRWLVDFEEAVRVGMGVRIQLAPEEGARGYEDLLVVGVKSSQDGAAGALRLAALLDSQHYTDGLAFVPQGTPTNNTPDAPSGFRSRDTGFEESYGAEIAGAAAGDALDNANVSAHALGIPGAAFSQIVGARDREQADARAMHTALWPSTWGYFLEQVLDETHTVEHVNVIRRLFIDHVRGRGPVPALRIGRQPYGILPASSLDKWKTDEGDPARAALVTLLRALRERWRTALARVPRMGRSDDTDRVDADLLELLAMEPVSSGFQGRPVVDSVMFGTSALPPLASALPPDILQRREAAQAALSALGVTWPIRALDFVFLHHARPLTGPLVQSGIVDARTMLTPDYVRWLVAPETGFAKIRDEAYTPELAPSGEKLGSLLFLLLRHSALVTFTDVAHRLLKSDNVASASRRPEPSLIGVLDSNGPRPLDELESKEAPSLGGARIGDRIHLLTSADHPAAIELDEFRTALAHLSGRTVAELERLLPEALDCCAHRLDAWITGLSADRLARMRDAQAQGVLIGGYGWVQHVRPDTTRTSVEAPPGEAGPLMRDAASGGFIHAPSLNQAATAAVLRSGYLTNRNSRPDQPFAIDLSSERIRRAQWLLDGVRSGQPLTALLGYRFERGLHENHPGLVLDSLIETFRTLAPLGEVYAARAEKKEARRLEGEYTASAATKRAEGARLRDQANQLLAQLQNSRPRVESDLRAAEREVSRFQEEIRKLQRPVFPPDPDAPRRLAALRTALAAAQKRVPTLQKRLADLDTQIRMAAKGTVQAAKDARQLENDARVLEASAASERERGNAAEAREEELLARRRATLLLPPAAGITAQESIAVENVVDGLALHRRYRKAIASVPARWDFETIPFGEPVGPPSAQTLPEVGSTDFEAVVAELAILDSSIDAVSDAVTAESVHQAMLGNPMRAGATLNAVAGGETPPPELEVIRTPRTGTAVTFRMAAVLPEPAAGATWPTDDLQARALVEPRVNAWAAQLLGDPQRVRGGAEYVVGGATAATREFSLDTLALSPLDLLWMAGLDPRAGAAVLLEQRLRHELLRSRPEGIPPDAVVQLNLGRADAWGTEILSVNEVMIVARTVSALISSSRTMDPRDLEPPESAGPPEIDVHDLGARVDRLIDAFEAAHAGLGTLLKSTTASAEQLRRTLLALTYFDVDSVPVDAQGGSTSAREALLNQAIAVHDETAKRVGQLRQAIAGVDRLQLGPADRLELENARVAIVLGKTFRVVPRFRTRNAAEFDPSLAAADPLGDDRLAPLTWMQRMARVRKGVARLNEVVTYSQSINPGVEPDLRVLQLPYVAGDRWAALPFGAGRKPAAAALSVVVQVPNGFPRSWPADLAGLMIDEWVEVTPSATEQSGLAFHFDAPGSRPPQAILLAVPPDQQPAWDIETLETIVTETLELAKLRMVTSADLDDQVSQFLPALFFGLNLANDTVSTDFQRAAAMPQP